MLTKDDSKMMQGIAILAMVALHLFCRKVDLPYHTHLQFGEYPAIYFIGLFGDICVPIYCFVSGYAQQLLSDREGKAYCQNRFRRLWKFIGHFWLILLIFSLIGLITGDSNIPGSISKFLGNFFLFELSYNGAWWFVLTYVFLVILSPAIVWIAKKTNPWLLALVSSAIYAVCFVLFFNYESTVGIAAIDWMLHQVLLFGRSLFPFVIGLLFCKCEIFEKLKHLFVRRWIKNCVIVLLPLILFLVHAVVQSLIVAPFTALGCIICFYLWEKPRWVKKTFLFFGKHSTNIWLVHMFFYMVLFENLVFMLREPLLIYIGMLAICICVSYLINIVEDIVKYITRRIKRV